VLQSWGHVARNVAIEQANHTGAPKTTKQYEKKRKGKGKRKEKKETPTQ